jgi:hypothetical protein
MQIRSISEFTDIAIHGNEWTALTESAGGGPPANWHDSLFGLNDLGSGEFMHLTSVEYTELTGFLDMITLDTNIVDFSTNTIKIDNISTSTGGSTGVTVDGINFTQNGTDYEVEITGVGVEFVFKINGAEIARFTE